jgi:hypothetical protein
MENGVLVVLNPGLPQHAAHKHAVEGCCAEGGPWGANMQRGSVSHDCYDEVMVINDIADYYHITGSCVTSFR